MSSTDDVRRTGFEYLTGRPASAEEIAGDGSIRLTYEADGAIRRVACAAVNDVAEAERHLIDEPESELEGASRALAGPGRTVERRVLVGRPADAILAEASGLDADLIAMGSRGHGPFKSALLGSVSTGVVNASFRPELVARASSVRRVLLATDGTDTSALALEIVATWPIFANVEITVLSVSEPAMAWATLDPVTTLAYPLEREAELADTRQAIHAELARAGADMLREAGRSVTDQVRVGNPAHEIVQEADAEGADLIVTGSRRSSARFPGLIGSVARKYSPACARIGDGGAPSGLRFS